MALDAKSEEPDGFIAYEPVDSVLENHLSKETINIVILGAGPVGLYLANALTILQDSEDSPLRQAPVGGDDDNIKSYPSIRIVIFENRVLTDGHKQPCSRTWGTAITPMAVSDTIDWRINSIFRAIFGRSRSRSLPLNVWETLLLLSNRDRGVKFVYGNVRDHEESLINIPILLMFDATGHRMEVVDRGENDETVDQNLVFSWNSFTPTMEDVVVRRWRIPRVWLKPRPWKEESLKIVKRNSTGGVILYPVLDNNRADIYTDSTLITCPATTNWRMSWSRLATQRKTRWKLSTA